MVQCVHVLLRVGGAAYSGEHRRMHRRSQRISYISDIMLLRFALKPTAVENQNKISLFSTSVKIGEGASDVSESSSLAQNPTSRVL